MRKFMRRSRSDRAAEIGVKVVGSPNKLDEPRTLDAHGRELTFTRRGCCADPRWPSHYDGRDRGGNAVEQPATTEDGARGIFRQLSEAMIQFLPAKVWRFAQWASAAMQEQIRAEASQ
jgi:hypothetical protein